MDTRRTLVLTHLPSDPVVLRAPTVHVAPLPGLISTSAPGTSPREISGP